MIAWVYVCWKYWAICYDHLNCITCNLRVYHGQFELNTRLPASIRIMFHLPWQKPTSSNWPFHSPSASLAVSWSGSILSSSLALSHKFKIFNLSLHLNIQWILTGNRSCHNMSIPNIWCDLWYKSKTTWLMDKNAISHLVDMAKGCHSAYGRVTSLCDIHLMEYCVFIHQPWGLAMVSIHASFSSIHGSH